MDAPSDKLPFIPPVDGCRIEKVHHVGPFVTRVELRLPDGRPWVWMSRRHRFLGGISSRDAEAGREAGEAAWWRRVARLTRVIWWTAILFMVGSTCFGMASSAGLVPGFLGDFASSPAAINMVFFVGSIFFTSAAYLQFLGAVNADRIAAIAHRRPPTSPLRWFALRPGEIGWLAAFSQFVGTVLFNINTFDVLLPGLGWLEEELLIWAPDALGSICFLVASGLALIEYGDGRLAWRPGDVSWWVVNVNMLGSVAFGISAIYAIVVPGSGELLDASAVNAWTLAGAICFFVGAYLLLPELTRNLKQVVMARPAGASDEPDQDG
jgi:hypothetical protein